MYKPALRQHNSLGQLFELIKFKRKFAIDHPDYFKPCGTCIFCGHQGSGKTLSAVNYVYALLAEFPKAYLVTNIALKDYPFNSYLRSDHNLVYFDGCDGRPVIQYSGLDDLKYVNNDEYGVIYLIDELHLELNSLESKNIDIDIITEISQQRKQRKHIVGTSQIFMRLAKPVREQIKDVILCSQIFGFIQFNKLIDGESSVEDGGKLKATVRGRYWYFHSPTYYNRYDTYAKMKRLNKEWNGRKRDPDYFFRRDN